MWAKASFLKPKALEASAAHRGAVEEALERRLVELGEKFQRGIHQLGARSEIGVSTDGRFAVPRADVLTAVAAEELAAYAIH